MYVSHDADDGTWQFFRPENGITTDDAMVVSLQSIIDSDPTIIEIADLPLGAKAIRSAVGEEWVIYYYS